MWLLQHNALSAKYILQVASRASLATVSVAYAHMGKVRHGVSEGEREGIGLNSCGNTNRHYHYFWNSCPEVWLLQ